MNRTEAKRIIAREVRKAIREKGWPVVFVAFESGMTKAEINMVQNGAPDEVEQGELERICRVISMNEELIEKLLAIHDISTGLVVVQSRKKRVEMEVLLNFRSSDYIK